MPTKITEVKSALAKLLATENLTVEYANVDTASFDVKNRILRIPTMKDLDAKTLDLFVGHEVAHALYTPLDGMENLPIKTQNFHSIVNVVEDARIERLIQKKYPGLKKPFYQAYGQLHEKDFFGTSKVSVTDMLLIDRLNLKAKLGTQIDLTFNDVEQKFFDRAMTTQTFEEVIELSKELFEYCEKELEEKQQNQEDTSAYNMPVQSEQGQDDEQSEGDAQEGIGNGMNAVTGTPDEQSEEEGKSASSPEEEGDDGEDKTETKAPAPAKEGMDGKAENTDGTAPGVKSITDQASQKSTKKLVETNEDLIPKYYDIPKTINFEKIVVPFSEIRKELMEYWTVSDIQEKLTKNAKEFKKKNEKVIAYLHKEFEMKKAADIYARANTTKTGVINSNLLYSYKYNEDIFMKKTNLPNGKNHGMMFFIDWSGSMSDNMKGTMEQLLCLALFCKKAQIPFAAYAFSSEYAKRHSTVNTPLEDLQSTNLNEFNVKGVSMLELFGPKMTTVQFNQAVEVCVALSHMWSRKYGYGDFAYMGLPRKYYLGGTPLDAAVIVAHKMVENFQKTTGAQVMNVCFLTDGSSHKPNGVIGYDKKYNGEEYYSTEADISTRGVFYIRDKSKNVTIKSQSSDYHSGDLTKALYMCLKASTGFNTMGFFLASGRSDVQYAFNKYIETPGSSAASAYVQLENWKKQFNKEKSAVSKISGLDELYILKGGKTLEVDDEGLDVEVGASKQKLTTAFKKAAKGKLQNRTILSKFIEKIAA